MTDITFDFCIIRETPELKNLDYSFSTPKIIAEENYKSDEKINFINNTLLNNVTELLLPSRDIKFLETANNINQFSKLRSNTLSYDAIKMANLDALTNISKHKHGVLIPRTYKPDVSVLSSLTKEYKDSLNINPSYIDFYGSPGGFTQYLLWRIPDLQGFGFTTKSKDKTKDWNDELLLKKEIDSLSDFAKLYGADVESGTGDLRTDGYNFVIAIEERLAPLGVDFVIANGDFSPVDTVLQILYAILTLRTGGDMLIRLTNSWDKIMVDALYLCSLIFESIDLIKPVTSPPWNFERYLFCKSKREEIGELTDLLFPLTEENPVFQRVDPNFEMWLRKMNDLLIQKQLNFLTDVIKVMNAETIKLVDLDLERAFILWNIPK